MQGKGRGKDKEKGEERTRKEARKRPGRFRCSWLKQTQRKRPVWGGTRPVPQKPSLSVPHPWCQPSLRSKDLKSTAIPRHCAPRWALPAPPAGSTRAPSMHERGFWGGKVEIGHRQQLRVGAHHPRRTSRGHSWGRGAGRVLALAIVAFGRF